MRRVSDHENLGGLFRRAVGDDPWQALTNGLPEEAEVRAIAIHPHNPQVVYTGTHDNATSHGWYEELPPHQRQNLLGYLNSAQRDSRAVAWHLMRLAWSSPAALAIAPLQDLLNLGAEARMNVPGRAEDNWSWRCTEELLSTADFHLLRDLTRNSNRLHMLPNPAIEMAEAVL